MGDCVYICCFRLSVQLQSLEKRSCGNVGFQMMEGRAGKHDIATPRLL